MGLTEVEKLRAEVTELKYKIAIAVEALQYISNPVTTATPTVEGLLHAMENDTTCADQALDFLQGGSGAV